ncbi:ParB/RepB/Spo0J family partition protein [Roseicyclus marinus]|uniref:ParB/RepB/Spo0J family partition protein n=1 Tax=Roseicyclus marinus TaxID=2161673 RepID=UPI002410897C|nr:ParB/RepB/Spo0J family partition protein [Roseicyclus marinus]MDG3040466.1 ParB/RepB/Spo0J family partition protein [Roseicyclus marinus]
MTLPADTIFVPLASLFLHDLNPRQTVAEAEIEDLATCLSMNGLIQNLVGLRDGKAKKIGIVAGGRRLRALQLLAKRGEPLGGFTDWKDAIPVRITTDHDEALRWSGAENEARAALHPADEVRLYRGLRDKALSPAAIARAHAVSELHVRRRLRLADLPDPVIEALRAGEITLDIAQAMTVGADEAAILSILDQTRGKDISARAVREALTRDAVRGNDRRAKFVGIDAYEAAGGRLTRDLFAEDHALHDQELLDRLFAEKLDAEAEFFKAEEGWLDVRPIYDRAHVPYDVTVKLHRLYPTPVELPEADAEELARLTDMDPDSLTQAEQSRIAELEKRREGDYTDEDRETGIAFVYVSHQGRLVVERAYTERAPKPARAERSDINADTDAPEEKGLSQALRMDLAAIRTAALQSALIDPDNLDLVFALITAELDVAGYHRLAHVNLNEPNTRPSIDEALTLPDAIAEIGVHGTAPGDPARISALLEDPKFLRQLQTALVRTISARPDNYGRWVEKEAGAEIRAHWRPTLANFWSRVPGPYLDRTLRTVLPDRIGLHDDVAAMKKADKAAELDRLFRLDPETVDALKLTPDEIAAIATWLPEEMK